MLNQIEKKTQVEIHFPHIYFLTQLHRDFLPQLEDILKQGLKLILSTTQHHIFMAMILCTLPQLNQKDLPRPNYSKVQIPR